MKNEIKRLIQAVFEIFQAKHSGLCLQFLSWEVLHQPDFVFLSVFLPCVSDSVSDYVSVCVSVLCFCPVSVCVSALCF